MSRCLLVDINTAIVREMLDLSRQRSSSLPESNPKKSYPKAALFNVCLGPLVHNLYSNQRPAKNKNENPHLVRIRFTVF